MGVSCGYSDVAGSTNDGIVGRDAGGNGKLEREINAEAAAVSDGPVAAGGAGAGADGRGRSLSNVTMRRSILVAEKHLLGQLE